MRGRRWLLLALITSSLFTQMGARYRYTPEDTLQALDDVGASASVRCIVYYEVGRGSPGFAPYDPNQVGAAGEVGAAQLLARGRLADFEVWAASEYGPAIDPVDPWQAVAYLAHVEATEGWRGLSAWTAYRWGWC